MPFTFLTNGGGKTEEEKAAELSQMLDGVPIDPALYIQSHTPYRELAPQYVNKTVVVVGQDPCKAREILLGYGFTDVVTTGELHAAFPTLWPFVPLPGSGEACDPQSARGPISLDTRYAAAFVINDPSHWQLDLQVLVDLLVSDGGRLGTTTAGHGGGGPATPHLYFSASDLEFSSAWPVPRFGQGSFLASLRGIWAAKTGGAGDAFPHDIHGKPMASQYSFVERTEKALQETRTGRHCVLERNYSKHFSRDSLFSCLRWRTLGLGLPPLPFSNSPSVRLQLTRYTAVVGDNPESDIRGALGYNSSQGTRWFGVLVKTGVWDGVSTPSVEPSFVADGVKEAVELIGRLENVGLTVA